MGAGTSERVLPDLDAVAIRPIDRSTITRDTSTSRRRWRRRSRTRRRSSYSYVRHITFGSLPLWIQWTLEDGGFESLEAYDPSATKDHDVYDCFYIALARRVDADAPVTTDRDFETPGGDEPFEYVNPVPEDVPAEFHAADGT